MRIVPIVIFTILLAGPLEAQYRPRGALARTVPAAVPGIGSTSLRSFLTPTPSADCDVDRVRGREAAGNTHSGAGWMVGGLASGFFLGLIGTGIITAVASSSSPHAERTPSDVEQACYRDGYTSKAKNMNTMSALTGGLIGTAALVLVIVSASGG